MTDILYVAVDIGCIECGEDSAVIGIYRNREYAENDLANSETKQKLDWSGQHSFEIFEAVITDE